jgi:iron complex transport system ATP-binding protein
MNAGQPSLMFRTEALEIGYSDEKGGDSFRRDRICVSAGEGEMVALIGPNGAGKSTLLRTLAGLQRRKAGSIFYGEALIDNYTPAELATLISFVSTEKVQVPLMSVSELVAFGRFPYTGWFGKLNQEDKEKVGEAMESTGIGNLARKMINEISDGERQRTMIARALAQDTPVIILDEPTAFLDISNTYGIFNLLHRLARERHKTIILSTHDLNIAVHETDKLWIMLERETVEGAPEDAILKGWLASLFSDRHIGFHAEEGKFYFRKEPAGTVSVSGNGLPYLLTVRALERKGYQISPEEETGIHITVVQESDSSLPVWEMVRNGITSKHDSIHGLVSEL